MQEEGEQQTHTELPKAREKRKKKEILRKRHYLPRHAPRHKMKSKRGHRAGELIFSPRCARPSAGSHTPLCLSGRAAPGFARPLSPFWISCVAFSLSRFRLYVIIFFFFLFFFLPPPPQSQLCGEFVQIGRHVVLLCEPCVCVFEHAPYVNADRSKPQ